MIEIVIHSATGSNKTDAFLYPESGMIKYQSEEGVNWEHISSLTARGSRIFEKIKEVKPEPKVKTKKVKSK